MKIYLKNEWFGPDGARRRKGEHEVPDAWEKLLPKAVKVLVGPARAKAPGKPGPTFDPGTDVK